MEGGDNIPEESSTDTIEVPKTPKRSFKRKSFKKPKEDSPKKKGKGKVPAKRKPKKKKGQKSVVVQELPSGKEKRIRKGKKKAPKERIAWSKLKKADLIRMAEEKELQIEYKKLTVLQLKQALGYVKRQLTDKQRAGIEKAKRTRAAKKAAGK